jgi:hypothetical protein
MARDPPRYCSGDIEDCMDGICLGHHLAPSNSSANKILKAAKVVRKEYRMLSDEERARFHEALLWMKLNGQYDSHARIHTLYGTGLTGAHYGMAFLPWHREFIKRLSTVFNQFSKPCPIQIRILSASGIFCLFCVNYTITNYIMLMRWRCK